MIERDHKQYGFIDFIFSSEQIKNSVYSSFEEALEDFPLYYDYVFFLGKQQEKPWLKREQFIPILRCLWEETEPLITTAFQNRNRKQVTLPMKKMILALLAYLFWTNEKPVPSLDVLIAEVKELKYKPVNVDERLAYILSSPNHHHAFTQLKQLFIEQNKKYAIAKLAKRG